MASYHLSAKTVKRSAGWSATEAYRAASWIACEREGRVHDYGRKQGAEDRERLWNVAEAAERRRGSVVAREWELALPAELDRAGRLELAEAFASALVERYEVATDVAIHTPHREGDQRNWHAHVLTTTRRLEAEGLGAKTKALDARATGGAGHGGGRSANATRPTTRRPPDPQLLHAPLRDHGLLICNWSQFGAYSPMLPLIASG